MSDLLAKKKPIITVKEARKVLGADFKTMTNEELAEMIDQSELVLRIIFREFIVHKNSMVK